MALHADAILERLRLKRQISKWRLAAVLALILLGLALVRQPHHGATPLPGVDYIARITIEGVIMDDAERDELLRDLAKDHRTKAVIVRLDTPGGSAVGGEELYQQLRMLAKTKPVVAVMRTMTASAGYMAALGTDHIIAREGTITGSIGVLMQMAEVTELAEKLGITPITIKSAPLKGSPSPFEKMTPEAQQAVQKSINDFYQVFVDIVTERRQLPREKVLQLADGRIYTGRQAKELQLIDALGGEEEALEWLKSEKKIKNGLDVIDRKVEKDDFGFIDKLADSAAKSALSGFFQRLDGLVAMWHANTL